MKLCPRFLTLVFVLLASAMPLAGEHDVPFHATIDTQPEVVGFCGPTCLLLHLAGSGTATHMGSMTTEGPSQVDLAGATQTATATLIAANGDTMIIDIAGTVTFTGPNPEDKVFFSGEWTVTSGSGRFRSTTGGGAYHGTAEGPAGTLIMDGSLSGIGRGR